MPDLHIDLETCSRVDLKAEGLYRYADSPTTKVLIACYAIDDEPIKRWLPWRREKMPADLKRALLDPAFTIKAHNASFERLMIQRVLKMPVKTERFYCTAYQCAANGLPRALENVPIALGISMRKDYRGRELMRLFSIPQADGTFLTPKDRPAEAREFEDYCEQDVNVERTISAMLPDLGDTERQDWIVNEYINDAGLPIDRELCTLAGKYRDAAHAEANETVKRIAGDTLTTARGVKLTRWVYDRVPELARPLMEVYKGGEKRLTMDKDTREALFALADERPEEFDEDVLDIIEASDNANAASIAKFDRMGRMASDDGRLRGAFLANGAAGTGRYSSKGAQVHNFPRVTAKDPEAVLKVMRAGGDLGGPVLQVLKSMLRPAITGGGGLVVRADWNAIEARGLPWLTKDRQADRYLEAFNDPERDIYVEQATATGLGGARQPGKVVVLSLGYGGAVGALSAMAKGYGVQIAESQKPLVVKRWRRANPWAPRFWYALDDAARDALRNEGKRFHVGRVAYEFTDYGGGWSVLWCYLPSGRRIAYPQPAIDEDGISYLKAAWKPKAGATEWPRARLWGGLAAENVTQAHCADLLRAFLRRGWAAGLPLVGHVHDEAVTTGVKGARAAKALARELEDAMLVVPEFSAGMPLRVEAAIAPRFGK